MLFVVVLFVSVLGMVFGWLKCAASNKLTPVAVSAVEYRSFPMVERVKLSRDTYLFRFQLQSNTTRLGLPVGKHILLRFKDADGKPISRPYTPVSSDQQQGYFELVIKVYPQGKMGPYLESLPLQSIVEVRGPLGDLHYKGNSVFSIKSKKSGQFTAEWYDRTSKHVNMIAGGTGITPMYQILSYICSLPSDSTHVTLLYASQTPQDILLKPQLDELQQKYANKVKIVYTVDRVMSPDGVTSAWCGEVGFVTKDLMSKHLSFENNNLTLCCGPKPMMDFLTGNFEQLTVLAENVFKF